jgi:hypothetical protein
MINNATRRNGLERLIERFGVERLISALPQADVRDALDLVSMQELAVMLGLNYNTLRSRMKDGKIPFPQVRLVRRAFFTRDEADAIAKAWQKQTSLGTNSRKRENA